MHSWLLPLAGSNHAPVAIAERQFSLRREVLLVRVGVEETCANRTSRQSG